MEVVEVFDSKSSGIAKIRRENSKNERVLVKRKTLQSVLEECQRALQLVNATDGEDDEEEEEEEDGEAGAKVADEGRRIEASSSMQGDRETDELCDLLKSSFECPAFLEKLVCAKASASQNIAEEGNSWDVVDDNDLWEGDDTHADQEDYVLVGQEDIVDGVACFMAAYLLSLEQTKDLSPNQLQEALSKTFSVKKRRGKLRKAWDGTRVIYNVASWGATAIGIYQNPAILKVATKAFWTSCQVISKLL